MELLKRAVVVGGGSDWFCSKMKKGLSPSSGDSGGRVSKFRSSEEAGRVIADFEKDLERGIRSATEACEGGAFPESGTVVRREAGAGIPIFWGELGRCCCSSESVGGLAGS